MLTPLLTVLWLHSLSLINAHTARQNVGCSFHLSCSGSFNGSVGQKSSGQLRSSSDVTAPTVFTWFGDAFVDQQGSGCWWTPPTFVLQCDPNQQPDHGFQIGCDGAVSYNGQTVFWECPTGQGDEVNISFESNGGQCNEVTMQADNCAPASCPGGGVSPSGGGGGAAPVSGAMSSPGASSGPGTMPSTLATAPSPSAGPGTGTGTGTTSTGTDTTTGTGTTGTGTTGTGTTGTGTTGTGTGPGSGPSPTSSGPLIPTPFTTGNGNQPTTTTSITSTSTTTVTATQPSASSPTTSTACEVVGPDSIILTDKGNPDTAYGPNQDMYIQVSPNASSIFNFRFNDTDAGRTCEMLFLLPPNTVSGSTNPSGNGNLPPYLLTGTGMVTFAALDNWADENTTYRTSPRVVQIISNTLLDGGGVALGLGRFTCPGSTSRSGVILTEQTLADTCLDCLQGNGTGMFLRKC
ncbi:hypothetical protein F5Y17DRAFT_470136 [Xylariaceae sp. FL0594]|nr:hypothetical protein F5Y17DRAFT_470136 [Xylariaceae sp. FL0594]